MIISNLSFINECADTNVTGGTYTSPTYDFSFRKNIDVKVKIDIYSDVKAYGAQNELTFDLAAFGYSGSGTEVQVTQNAGPAYFGGHGYASSSKGAVISYAR